MWTKNLSTAPKAVPASEVVIACGPTWGMPVALHYVEVNDPNIPIDGYWDYFEDTLSGVTGGVPEEEWHEIMWMVIDLPETVTSTL